MNRFQFLLSISTCVTTPWNGAKARAFGNPLTTPLPYAPNMKIFCLYGVGKPTERAGSDTFINVLSCDASAY